jgi:hypothetical protein
MWFQKVYDHKKGAYGMFTLPFRIMTVAGTCPDQPLTIGEDQYGILFSIQDIHNKRPPVFPPANINNPSVHIEPKALENSAFSGISIDVVRRKSLQGINKELLSVDKRHG